MNLTALLFEVAHRLPDRRAVSDDRQSWNYAELAERIAWVAGGLRAYGLVPGDRVPLSLENCGEFFELLFGCWAAVPANARLHPREVEYIAENSGARLLVATPGLVEALAPLETSVASLDRVITTRSPGYDALLAAGEPLRPEPGTPTDRAWLILSEDSRHRSAAAPGKLSSKSNGLVDSIASFCRTPRGRVVARGPLCIW
jgi:acyl-CoA synthetase (AMP-forming)/AMP-acid ligase II